MPPAPGQEEPMKRVSKIVDWLITRPDCAPFREPVDWRGLELWDYPEIIDHMMDLGTIKRRLERGYYSKTYQVAEDVKLVWRNCMAYNVEGSDFWLLAKQYTRRFDDRYRKIRQEYDVGEDDDDLDDEDDDSDEEEEAARGSIKRSYSGGGGGGGSSSSKAGGSSSNSTTKTTPKAASYSGGSFGNNNFSADSSSSSPAKQQPNLDARAQFGANLFLLSGTELGYVISTCEEECPKALENVRGGDESCCHIEINVDSVPAKVFDVLNTYVSGKVGQRNASLETSSSHGSDSGRPKKKQKK